MHLHGLGGGGGQRLPGAAGQLRVSLPQERLQLVQVVQQPASQRSNENFPNVETLNTAPADVLVRAAACGCGRPSRRSLTAHDPGDGMSDRPLMEATACVVVPAACSDQQAT